RHRRGPLALRQIVISDGREVDAVLGTEVMPEVVAGVDLQEIEAPIGRVALEVELERALEPQLRHDLAPERRQLIIVRKLEVGAVAGECRVSADFPADERGEQLGFLVGETVKGPERAIVARHVLLEGELADKTLHERVLACGPATREDARLAGAAEQLLVYG